MDRYAFEIVGSRPLNPHDEPVPLGAQLQSQVQEGLESRGWNVYWSTNFDRAGVGAALYPMRVAPVSLMREIEALHPLYLLSMPWGTAIYLEPSTRTLHYIVSSPYALEQVFFSDLGEADRQHLRASLEKAMGDLREVGRTVVGEVTGKRFKGARFSGRPLATKERYADVIFQRTVGPEESQAKALEETARKMGRGLDDTFFWHVSGVAPVSETATITMTCHVPYARLAMQMGTYHCPALPCTTVAYVEGDQVKAAMLKPLHMFRTFFRDVPLYVGLKYVRFPFAVRKEIAACLRKYLD